MSHGSGRRVDLSGAPRGGDDGGSDSDDSGHMWLGRKLLPGIFLWRVPIILTTNIWRLDKLTDEDSEWVNANCIVVHVAEPVFDARRMRV